jgi:hypothetical protein
VSKDSAALVVVAAYILAMAALAVLASRLGNRVIIGGKCAVTHAFLCY